jgi:TRAP-type C4-dicarboxylate transport system permease small subunit
VAGAGGSDVACPEVIAPSWQGGRLVQQQEGHPEEHLIHVEDEEIQIEHYPDDWFAFGLFWVLAFIVFLQFFTRYVLNDSLAWTEEIARYLLMVLTFLGSAIVVRKGAHIAVEVFFHFLPPRGARILLAIVEVIQAAFIGLLFYFSLTVTQRMHLQRMTVIDLPMSLVYGPIAFGCLLMLLRALQRLWRNARDGWQTAYASIGSTSNID